MRKQPNRRKTRNDLWDINWVNIGKHAARITRTTFPSLNQNDAFCNSTHTILLSFETVSAMQSPAVKGNYTTTLWNILSLSSPPVSFRNFVMVGNWNKTAGKRHTVSNYKSNHAQIVWVTLKLLQELDNEYGKVIYISLKRYTGLLRYQKLQCRCREWHNDNSSTMAPARMRLQFEDLQCKQSSCAVTLACPIQRLTVGDILAEAITPAEATRYTTQLFVSRLEGESLLECFITVVFKTEKNPVQVNYFSTPPSLSVLQCR